MTKLSERMRTLLSTWMAGYARPLVEECAQEAAQLEDENEALRDLLKKQTLWSDKAIDTLLTAEESE